MRLLFTDLTVTMFRAGSSSFKAVGRFSRTLATHTGRAQTTSATRHDWTKTEIRAIYDTPLLDLVFRSAAVHRQHHDPTKIQLCTLMNIKSESATYWARS